MKREWGRRPSPKAWLLLHPGADDTWRWLLVERGAALREGHGQPPMFPDARVALVVPGDACSHFQLAAPPGLKRDEWPMLLEDRLLQGPEEALCACIGRPTGQLRLVTVDRVSLAQWQEQCTRWGLQVTRCWAAFQLLPEGQGWHWRQGSLDLLKASTEDGRERWLAWPHALGAVPADWADLDLQAFQGDWPPVLADLDRLPSLQEPRRVRPNLPRLPLRLAVACLALASLWGGLWLAQQWRQAEMYRQQVLALTGPQATPRQAAQALKQLREADTEHALRLRRLEDLQGQLQAWLQQHPGWRVQAVRFDGQRWHVQLQGEGLAPPWREMADAVGVPVEVGSAVVAFDLGGAV